MQSLTRVFKFGGASVGSVAAIRGAAALAAAEPRLVVVVSAMRGVTDLLLGAARAAQRGDLGAARAASDEFRARHLALLSPLLTDPARLLHLRGLVDELSRELSLMCEAIAILRELTPRTEDAVVARGERALAQIFAAHLAERAPCSFVDAVELISTTRRLDGVWPDFPRCEEAARALLVPRLDRGERVVVPGFIGRGPEGEVVTLGRGGSDFSASILGRCLGAESVTLYKEVDGLMTADPRAVPDARVLPALHYREAAELAYYGAKVLHPRTMIPLVQPGIPLFLKNSFNPSFSGTRVAGDVVPGAYPVKALTTIQGQALLSVEGGGMMGVPGVAQKTFAALATAGHSVSMISQASSEASICLVLPESEAGSARAALEEAFTAERAAGLIDEIRVEGSIALIAVVGLGMRGTPGISQRTFTALGQAKVNILAIAQGSSELNITIALKEPDAARALLSLHQEFQLDRLRPLADSAGREVALAFLGAGNIGRALAKQLAAQARYFSHDLGFGARYLALIDRSGLWAAEGKSEAEIEAALQRKARGERLLEEAPRPLSGLVPALRTQLFALPARCPVLVDLTAEETAPILLDALSRGFHVVSSNKKPLAASQAEFDALQAAARERGRWLRYEATVGAGLPILDTLAKLSEAGDAVREIEGCFSGTLGYLMTQVEAGVSFSEAVRQAYLLGYTEPDPRDDLSGLDVARKALILARTLGVKRELSEVPVVALFPEALSDNDPQRFMEKLRALDAEIAGRARAARDAGRALRYVARVSREGARVGLEEVPAASPLGRLRGTDNSVAVYSRRYDLNPLVVTGPGAGAEVTAAGVLNDIVAVALGQEKAPRKDPSHG